MSTVLALSPAAAWAQVSTYQTVRVVDAIVNNTDPNLKTTDTFTDHESSIAINPLNPREVVVLGFSDAFQAIPNHPIFRTTDSGATWTKVFSVPQPPGIPDMFVNDWTPDWGRNNLLSIAILGPTDIVTVVTNNATAPSAFTYRVEGGEAQLTNHLVPSTIGRFDAADQPWTLTNRDTSLASQDNVYTAWDDFGNFDGIDGPDVHVTASYGVVPLDFTVDRQVGNSTTGINPGLRIAKDPTTGTMYALWQRCVSNCGFFDSPKTINYMLNRSTDGGHTWALNGNPMGVVIATANSTQPWPKFAGVNALLGGIDHAAVDPRNGAVYYAYGNQDAGGIDRIAIRRLTFSAGNVVIGPETIVSTVESAIPQVAVDNNGTVGVFFYSFEGLSAAGRPNFRGHLSLSVNQAASFTDRTLLAFESPEAPDGDNFDSQRVLGDFAQMKSLDSCFYGGFTGNGAALGRTVDNTDPIYFQVCQQANPCLLATQTINVGLNTSDRTQITASVDAGALIQIGSHATITGNVIGLANAFMQDNATVAGNLTLSGVLQHQNIFTITGTLTEHATVTIPALATKTVTAGTGNQSVANNAVVTLTPGQYGNMTINAGARVTLQAGTYNFLSLNIQPDVTITDNAATNVNVAGALTWSDRVRVQSTITHPLTVYTNATNVRIGTDGIFNGFLLAPNASLSIAGRTSFLGCLGARSASFEPDVTMNSGGSTLPSSATM
jgi:hypothetical protein